MDLQFHGLNLHVCEVHKAIWCPTCCYFTYYTEKMWNLIWPFRQNKHFQLNISFHYIAKLLIKVRLPGLKAPLGATGLFQDFLHRAFFQSSSSWCGRLIYIHKRTTFLYRQREIPDTFYNRAQSLSFLHSAVDETLRYGTTIFNKKRDLAGWQLADRSPSLGWWAADGMWRRLFLWQPPN